MQNLDKNMWHNGDGEPFCPNEGEASSRFGNAQDNVGGRSLELVQMAAQHGVPLPSENKPPLGHGPQAKDPIAFIENKVVDFERVHQILAPSRDQNHHANGGPASRILAQAVQILTQLPETREVVAVNNGTSALHLACGVHAAEAGKPHLRWVTSAFNFYSCLVGPLADGTLIDCDANGGFSLDALRAIPLDTYDGVIYTNIFAQQSNWDHVADYCREHEKYFVVDNATGLLDRPKSSRQPDAPIESISAHHTKPWGFGEGGFVICSPQQAEVVHKLTNFGTGLPAVSAYGASNFKISDWSAAAIIDRLERFDIWAPAYHRQEQRYRDLINDSGLPIVAFDAGLTPPKSPRAHFAMMAQKSIPILDENGPITIKKYYPPLPKDDLSAFPMTALIYDQIFSFSNAPEMRLVPDAALVQQIQRLLDD